MSYQPSRDRPSPRPRAVMTSLRAAMSRHGMRPFALAPGDGTSVENPAGGVTTFKAASDESGGGLTVIEGVSAPGEGPPLHVHREQDEFIYTLDGTFRVRLGDDLIEVLPGSFVFIPRNTPHTWQNVGEGPARFIATLIPASVEFEEFFLRYGELPPEERGSTRSAASRPRRERWRYWGRHSRSHTRSDQDPDVNDLRSSRPARHVDARDRRGNPSGLVRSSIEA